MKPVLGSAVNCCARFDGCNYLPIRTVAISIRTVTTSIMTASNIRHLIVDHIIWQEVALRQEHPQTAVVLRLRVSPLPLPQRRFLLMAFTCSKCSLEMHCHRRRQLSFSHIAKLLVAAGLSRIAISAFLIIVWHSRTINSKQ